MVVSLTSSKDRKVSLNKLNQSPHRKIKWQMSYKKKLFVNEAQDEISSISKNQDSIPGMNLGAK